MNFIVSNDLIRSNIELFKIYLQRIIKEADYKNQPFDLTFSAFVHSRSGQMIFDEEKIPSQDKSLFKTLSVRLFMETVLSHRLCIESLCEKDFLDTEAHYVLTETIKTLQAIARMLTKTQSVSSLLQELSLAHLEQKTCKSPSEDVIHLAWHQVCRKGAEKLLKLAEVGTFIFRKDPYATILENELSRAHCSDVKCVTLSYKDFKQGVCEYTLVKTALGWMIYTGDPSLDEPVFPDIDTFLQNMKGILKSPFVHY